MAGCKFNARCRLLLYVGLFLYGFSLTGGDDSATSGTESLPENTGGAGLGSTLTLETSTSSEIENTMMGTGISPTQVTLQGTIPTDVLELKKTSSQALSTEQSQTFQSQTSSPSMSVSSSQNQDMITTTVVGGRSDTLPSSLSLTESATKVSTKIESTTSTENMADSLISGETVFSTESQNVFSTGSTKEILTTESKTGSVVLSPSETSSESSTESQVMSTLNDSIISSQSDSIISTQSENVFSTKSETESSTSSESVFSTESEIAATPSISAVLTESDTISTQTVTVTAAVTSVTSSQHVISTQSETYILPSSTLTLVSDYLMLSTSSVEVVSSTILDRSSQVVSSVTPSTSTEGRVAPQGAGNGGKIAAGVCVTIIVIIAVVCGVFYYRRFYRAKRWSPGGVSFKTWSYTNATYHDDENMLIMPSMKRETI